MAHDFVDVTILGGGPVGLFAAFYAGLRGMSVRIVDSLSELGGQLVALYPEKYVYDMPGFPKILAKDLATEMVKQGIQFSPEVLLEETVETLEIIGEAMMLVTRNEVELPTRTLIIAAGAGAFSPTRIGVEREAEFEGKGIFYGVKSLAEFKGKRVSIVGGGDSAFDWCLALEPIAESVTLIHRRDQFRAHEDTVRKVRESSVKMQLWNVVKELHGAESLTAISLENVESKQIETREVDAVIVNVGFKSSLGPLKNWNIDIEKNQIQVNPTTMETNIPGVFAIGDVAGFEGKLKLIANGVGEAVTAVCKAKQRLDPNSKLFPGHSSDRDL